MNNLKKSQIKQLIILLIVLVVIFVVSFCVERFLINDSTTEVSTSEETESESEEVEYTINGMTKAQWEAQEVFIDEDNYNTVMALFEDGLTEDIEIDFEALADEEANENIEQEDIDEVEALIKSLNE